MNVYYFVLNSHDYFRRSASRTWHFHGRYVASVRRLLPASNFVLHLRRVNNFRFYSSSMETIRFHDEIIYRAPVLRITTTATFTLRISRFCHSSFPIICLIRALYHFFFYSTQMHLLILYIFLLKLIQRCWSHSDIYVKLDEKDNGKKWNIQRFDYRGETKIAGSNSTIPSRNPEHISIYQIRDLKISCHCDNVYRMICKGPLKLSATRGTPVSRTWYRW